MKRLLKRAAGLIFSPAYARLTGTRHLLRTTDLSDEDIAERAGFESACAFTRAFVHHYGVGPQAHRGSHRACDPTIHPDVLASDVSAPVGGQKGHH